MLKSIRKLDRKQREGVLADLVLSRGAPDQEEGANLAPNERELVSQVLSEVGQALQVDPRDKSPDVRRKVDAFLRKTLHELTFDGSKIGESRNRLGHEGILPSELYDVKFMQDFADLAEPFGITRQEVNATIKSPSAVEHYLPERLGQTESYAISLFARHFFDSPDPYTLLIDSQRTGSSIEVHYALRIFHADVNVATCNKAIDMLRLFADVYGMDFYIEDQKHRFVFYEVIPASQKYTEQTLFQVREEDPVDFRFTFRRREAVWEIALAYAVATRRYVESLRARGIEVRRNVDEQGKGVTLTAKRR